MNAFAKRWSKRILDLHVDRVATWAANWIHLELHQDWLLGRCGRADAVTKQFRFGLRCDPIGGPGGCGSGLR